MLPTMWDHDPFLEFRLISNSVLKDLIKGENVYKDTGFPRFDQFNKSDGSVVLEFPLAGYKRDELSVSVDGQRLVVKAETNRNEEDADDEKKRVVRGRPYKSFTRAFTANETMDLMKVSAKFEDGLLVVEIPKKDPEKDLKVKEIQIK